MKTMLVAHVKQHAVMRAVQEKECHEHEKAIEYMNESHKRFMSMMECKQELMGEVPQLQETFCHEIRISYYRISAEEWDLLENKQAMEELLKERRNTEVEEWRDTVVAEGGVTHKATVGSRSSEVEGDLFVFEVVVHQNVTGQVEAPPQMKKSSKTDRVGGDTTLCVSAPADESLGSKNGGGGRKEQGGELCPECSQRATLGPAHVG